MPLIIGLAFYFVGAFVVGLLYNLFFKKRRTIEALHLSTVFALAITALVFVLAVAFDLLDITPEA